MEGIRFKDILKSFENKVEEENYKIPKKPFEETKIISNDVKRTRFLSIEDKDEQKIRIMMQLTYDILVSVPITYIQGMSEISSVFVIYYFSEDYDNYSVQFNDSDSSSRDKEDSIELFSKKDIDDEKYEAFKKEITKKLEKIRIVLTNVFRRKFEPLVNDDFKIYKENVSVFIALMKTKNIKIKETDVHRYMGSILTFFYRNVDTIENAYKMFEVILSCPNSTPFLLLVIYYDNISKNIPIGYVDENLYKSVILLEEEFVKIQTDLKTKKKSFFSRNAVMIGGAVCFVAAVALYKINKKE